MTTICAWCHRVRVGGEWVERRDVPPDLMTHDICPECSREHFGEDIEEEECDNEGD